jgi:hypothetical protein
MLTSYPSRRVVLAVVALALAASACAGRSSSAPSSPSAVAPRMDASGTLRLDLGGGRALQALLVQPPGGTGEVQLHLTYYTADGSELAVPHVTVTAAAGDGTPASVAVTKYSAGHDLATATLAPGDWTFTVDGRRPGGEHLRSTFVATVGSGA